MRFLVTCCKASIISGIAGLIAFALIGCVSPTWLAQQIINPERQSKFDSTERVFAKPFYKEQISLDVSSPDIGSIDAAVIEPTNYDPEITFSYRKNQSEINFGLNFPKLPSPPNTLSFQRLASKNPARAYAERLRTWLPTLALEKPVGTVIMLPGFNMGKASLLPGALMFANRGWRVVLVDLRGQGSSLSKYLTWGIKDQTDLHRLVAVLVKRHILVHPWLYFGESYGGGVALMAAAGGPKPDGVIAIAPWADASQVIPRFAHYVAGWFAPSATSRKWEVAEKQAGYIAGINFDEARPIKAVPSIHAPILFVGGSADTVAPEDSLRSMAQKSSDATVEIMPGLTHIAVVADVPELCLLITSWLHSKILLTQNNLPCNVTKSDNNGLIKVKYVGE